MGRWAQAQRRGDANLDKAVVALDPPTYSVVSGSHWRWDWPCPAGCAQTGIQMGYYSGGSWHEYPEYIHPPSSTYEIMGETSSTRVHARVRAWFGTGWGPYSAYTDTGP